MGKSLSKQFGSTTAHIQDLFDTFVNDLIKFSKKNLPLVASGKFNKPKLREKFMNM